MKEDPDRHEPTASGSTTGLAAVLLRLLATRQSLDSTACAAWTDADWSAVLTMLAQHRLGPLLHWRLTHEHAHVQVPDSIRAHLREAFRDASLRSLALQGDLLKVHRLLESATVAYIVLKGPFLAAHAYPHAALRPMRDLDVLVPMRDIMRTFDLLLANGLMRSPHFPGDPQAFLDSKKHFPPVRAPSGRAWLELHGRLVTPAEISHAGPDALDEDAVWARRITVDGPSGALSYMAPTDLLLHLIVHAAYDHRFDNGPLVLSDIAYLLDRHEIDWPLFWSLAERGQWDRGARLLLRMTLDSHELSPAALAAGRFDAIVADDDLGELARTAALLTLRDVSVRRDENLLVAIDTAKGLRHRLGILMGKVFPSRRQIAAQFSVNANSPAIAFGYVLRWKFVLGRAIQVMRNARSNSGASWREQRDQRHRVESLDRWLHHETN